jgi:hypothetical protein
MDRHQAISRDINPISPSWAEAGYMQKNPQVRTTEAKESFLAEEGEYLALVEECPMSFKC